MAKRSRYDAVGAATAQFYNATGTVPTGLSLAIDVSYLFSNQPSCIIVVADIPPNCSESDLTNLFCRYGQVNKVQIMCNGHAALVEFAEISTPTRLVHMAKINPFCIGQNRVRLEFSSETIRSDERKANNFQSGTNTDDSPTRILHLDVASADYAITVDVIKAICSPHGKILRIFIGKKEVDRSLQVLVEFETINEAIAAKKQLDGADIYSGCCSLTVAFSRLARVHVTKNDTESWDFTNMYGTIETSASTTAPQRTLLGNTTQTSIAVTQPASQPILPPPNMPPPPVAYPGMPPNMMPPVPQMMPPPTHPPTGYYNPPYGPPPPPMYGYVPSNSAPPPMQYPHMPQFRQQQPTGTPPRRPSIPTNQTMVSTPSSVHQVSASGIGIGHSNSSMTPFGQSSTPTDTSIFETIEGVVLMACNLPSKLNCDHIFNLLCLYGNIARIKFLKTRPGCAMIQVGTVEAADFIHRFYNGIKIFGQDVQIHHSKQTELSEHENPGSLADGSPVMKNYMSDPNNRFRNAIVAAKSRILDPSKTLHFFNAPLNFSPQDLCRVFTDSGATTPPRLVIFNPKPGQKTSLGLIEWDSISDSLEALALVNHRPIHLTGVSHPFHLKLAFSPKPISDDRPGVSLIHHAAPTAVPHQVTHNTNNGDQVPAEETTNGLSEVTSKPSKRTAREAELDTDEAGVNGNE